MPFDFKKEYKEFYMPPKKPVIVDVPQMNFIAVRGRGNPNDEDGEYRRAMGLLYGVAFTASKAILTMWCRLWKASGGRRACRALITRTRRISAGSRSFVCRIL